MALALLLFLAFKVLGASSEVRQFFLKQVSGQDCQTLQLGESWTSHSPITCQRESLSLYSENCQSVVYNSQTRMCTPGSIAFGPLDRVTTSIPESSLSDKLYFVRQPIPPCNTSNNFALYDVCGTSACLYFSTSKAENYSDARTLCSQMNSSLFVGNTMAKFSLLWHTSKTYMNADTFIGLQDIDVEGNFVWENGEPLSYEQKQYIWLPKQPDNKRSRQDCAVTWPSFNSQIQGLDDERCNIKRHFICERCGQC
ncbi:hypothetical protein RRG08_055647 [Elysia crispata]|uniref:C-type lectin domain-containing protein n=1 Tax=Elysia crispata TaxID=231223 RepID=A0AAE0Z816_9GAST|nr:hypothetical protein RRG08_055647 [Elysia crispata]